MANLSEYARNAFAAAICNGTNVVAPTTLQVGLFTSAAGLDSSDSSLFEEVTGSGYSRMNATPAFWGAASDGVCTNTTPITFGPAESYWGTVTHLALIRPATEATPDIVYMWKALDAAQTVYTGDDLRLLAGDFSVTME